MRIATFNINGIRAAQRRGFEEWLRERQPDVVALQEVRAPAAAVPPGVFGKYHFSYEEGVLPGRNGVGILTMHPPAAVRTWSGRALVRAPGEDHSEPIELERVPLARGLKEFADEGRYIEVDLADAPIAGRGELDFQPITGTQEAPVQRPSLRTAIVPKRASTSSNR